MFYFYKGFMQNSQFFKVEKKELGSSMGWEKGLEPPNQRTVETALNPLIHSQVQG